MEKVPEIPVNEIVPLIRNPDYRLNNKLLKF